MFSDENGKTFYKNLHKYDKTEESIYVGALGIVAPQLTIELIAEYGSVALVAEGGAILESSGQEAIVAVVETEEASIAATEGVQYTKSSLKLGQEMHKAYKMEANGIKEFRLMSG